MEWRLDHEADRLQVEIALTRQKQGNMRQVEPAPHLMGNGCCSECRIRAMPAGNGDLKVCPECHGLLWHADWGGQERLRRQEAALAAEAHRQEAARLREEERKARIAAKTGPRL
jgi:hypothetical protein